MIPACPLNAQRMFAPLGSITLPDGASPGREPATLERQGPARVG